MTNYLLLATFSVLFPHGCWFLLFRTPVLPHLLGVLWGKPYMTSDDLADELIARGHFKAMFLWLCTYCQATWTALLSTSVMGWLVYRAAETSLSSIHPLLVFPILTIVVWVSLIPLFWLLQKPFGHNTMAEAVEEPVATSAPVDEPTKIIIPKLSPEENKVMLFFGSSPCDFPGWEELRRQYREERAKAQADPDCPPCKIGEIVRKYRELVRIAYGFTKEQVPDLHPGQQNNPASNPTTKIAAAGS